MKYIYISSTYPLYLGLYLQSKGEVIHYLYTRSNYRYLFESLNLEATFIDVPPSRDIIFKQKRIRERIKEINNIIGANDLLFTHLQFANWLFIILSNRNKGAKSYYYNYEPRTRNKIPLLATIQNYRSFYQQYLVKIVLRLFFNTDTIFSFYAKTFFLSLNENCFMNYNIVSVKTKISFESILIEILPHIQIPDISIDNLFIAGSELDFAGTVYNSEAINRIKEFIENSDISVKPHPSGWQYPKSTNIISPHLPSELLLNNIKNSLISINSTTLIAASNYYHDKSNVKIICLILLVEYIDEESGLEMLSRIKNRSKDNILFPKSLQELSRLLNNSKLN
jgi:hypothetical protein